MSKSSVKKEIRRKKRNKKKFNRNRQFQKRREIISQFPKLEICDRGTSPFLVEDVKRAFANLAAEHEKLLNPDVVEVCRLAKQVGFVRAIRMLLEDPARIVVLDSLRGVCGQVGQALFEYFPQNVFERYFPFSAISVNDLRNKFEVTIHSLQSTKTPGGTAYFSSRKPQVEFKQSQLTAAFFRHAIERICERSKGNWRTYGGVIDAFAFLDDCVYYEPWQYKNNTGFVIYESCVSPFISWTYAKEILQKEPSPEEKWYYRVGYCPAVEVDGLFIAKTLLVPGMQGTPEYDWYLNNVSNTTEARFQLHEQTGKLTTANLAETGDFSLLKNFHNGGIPQVLKIDRQVYVNEC